MANRFPCFLLVCALLGGQAAPQENGRPKVRAYRLETPPALDGRVNEDLWGAIPPATDFLQQEPDEGFPASERTEVRIGFDNDNLYVAIICFDSQPENIVVTQNRRDAALDNTDSIIVLLDTFNDDQNAFLFGTSPTGIEYDAQVSKAGQGRGEMRTPQSRSGGTSGQSTSDGRRTSATQRGGASAFNLNWDGVWKVRSQITERGWESEMVIPFKTLRYASGRDAVWGLNISRNLRRRNEQSFWSPVSRAFTLNQVELAGDLEGLDLQIQRNLKLIPYVLGGLKQDYTLSQNRGRAARDAGLDIKYSLTPALTLDATFNTDFAQVEVDEEQINLTRFDLFFPEKRPFFLENAGTFEFGTPQEVEIFFSRRIGIDESGGPVPIDAGLRLSGKVGNYQIGLLNMQTRRVAGRAPANNFGAVRVSRQLRNRSSLGFIGVSRQSTSRSASAAPFNRTFGADANIGFGRYANWFSYAAKTQSPGRQGSDHAFASLFEYESPNHRSTLAYVEVGRNFNPEVGFLRRAGYRRPRAAYGYQHYPEGSRIRSIYPHVQWNGWYTLGSNEKESAFHHYDVSMSFHSGATLSTGHNRYFERIDAPFEIFPGIQAPPGRYRFSEGVIRGSTDPTAPFFAGGSISGGPFYGGSIRTFNVNGGYRRGQNLTWIGAYTRNFIRLPRGDFNTDLASVRFNWSFTPKRYLQSLTQFNSRTNQVGANIRLAILSTASTGFFLVYNTRVATVDFFDPHEVERRTLSRALLFKFNYLFDF